MPSVSCRCRFPSFLYRVYQQPCGGPRSALGACVALCGVLAPRGRRHVHKRQYGTAERRLKCSRRNLSATSSRAKFLRPECFKRTAVAAPDAKQRFSAHHDPRIQTRRREQGCGALRADLSMKKIATSVPHGGP